MSDLCPDCGANLAIVGKAHNCRPRKKPAKDMGDAAREGYRAYMREYMRKWRAKKRKAK